MRERRERNGFDGGLISFGPHQPVPDDEFSPTPLIPPSLFRALPVWKEGVSARTRSQDMLGVQRDEMMQIEEEESSDGR